MDDDTHLAMAVLAVCDALDEGATNAESRIASVMAARKHAHAVINRGHRSIAPADEPAEGETE